MPVPARPLPRRHAPVARALARLRARPLLWWAATLAVTVATAGAVAGTVAQAQERAARFGSLRPVLVATRDLAPGAPVDAGSAEVVRLPAALVPDGATGAEALGRRATQPIHAGEVVHRDRVAPGGLSAVTARLPAGSRGVAVPSGAGALPLELGDVVDVLATVGDVDLGTGATSSPPTVTVAAGAVVVDVGEQSVTVAVTQEQAPRVAYAVTSGIATLALVPW